jgi:hypothetical protein
VQSALADVAAGLGDAEMARVMDQPARPPDRAGPSAIATSGRTGDPNLDRCTISLWHTTAWQSGREDHPSSHACRNGRFQPTR